MTEQGFDVDTETLTRKGWLQFQDLSINDFIASYNMEADQAVFDRPLHLRQYQYSGLMHKIRSLGIDLLITPGQSLLHKLGQKLAPWHKKPVSLMQFPDARVLLKVSAPGSINGLELKEDEIKLCAWFLADGHYYRSETRHWLRTRKSWAEYGCVSVFIGQRSSKVHMVTEIIDNLGWPYSLKKRDKNITHVCGRMLKKKPEAECSIRLKKTGAGRIKHLVPDKHRLPAWVQDLSQSQFMSFLGSYVDGDGSRHPRCPETSWMVYGNKRILDDLQGACLSHGVRASLSTYRGVHYRLNVTPGEWRCLDRYAQHLELVPYSGSVWLAAMPMGTIIVRRNGCPVIAAAAASNNGHELS